MNIQLINKRIVHCTFLVILVILVYSGTLGFPFQFDDYPNITDNPIIRVFSFFTDTERATGFSRYDALRSRYVGYLTFFLNYRVHGLNVAGYRLVNILTHILNSLLVYALIVVSFQTAVLRESRLFKKRCWVALLASAMFAVHPVNTQAVTYIVQRFASLTTLFYLGSMVCYVKARLELKQTSQWGYYLLCLLCSILAMKTKENAFTLPLAITIYELLFFRRGGLGKRAILLLPVLLTMLIIPLTLVDLDKPISQVMADVTEKTIVQPMGRTEYLLTETRVIMTYLRLLVLPMNQILDYDYPKFSSMAGLPITISFIVIGVFVAFAVHLIRKKDTAARFVSYGIFFFFLALSVESSLIPLFPIYEHRLYLPGIGLLIAISAGAIWLLDTLQEGRKRVLFLMLCVITVLTLAAQTVKRNAVWQSELTLWRDVVKKAPGNARGEMALGVTFDRLGDFKQAEQHYLSAIKLRPDFSEAYINLGASYGMQGKLTDAMKSLEHAIWLNPRNDDAYNNLGNTFFLKDELDKAVQYYAKALEFNAGAVSSRVNLFKIFVKQGKKQSAEEQLSYLKIIAPEQASILSPLLYDK